MELGTVIMTAIILAVIIVPFLMLNRNSNKTKNQVLQVLDSLAKKHNCQLSQQEFGRSFAIGMDETNHFVFFYKKVKEHEYEQFVDLSKIQFCKVENISRTAKINGLENKYVDRLYLSFVPLHNDKPEVRFEFFNSDITMQLGGELWAINKWVQLINVHLEGMPRPNRAAG